MFLDKIIYKLRIAHFYKRYYRNGVWEITHDNILELANILNVNLLRFYNPIMGNEIVLRVTHKNVYVVIELLKKANVILMNSDDVISDIQKPRNEKTLSTIRLDDFLVTNDYKFIEPYYVALHLKENLKELFNNLNGKKTKNVLQYEYYSRQYIYLLEEVFYVLVSLMEVSVYARKQRSGKTAYFTD